MPRIPLYNQGAGSRVGVASGQLSPRASEAAFTAPGRAMAGFQKTFSDIGDVAKEFAIEQQNQEANRVLQEETVELGRAARDFVKKQNFSTTDEARSAMDTFFASRKAEVLQNNPNLNSRQQRFLFNQIQPDISRYTLQSEEKAFNQGRLNKSTTANQLAQSLISDGKLTDEGREIAISKYNQIYDNAVTSGFGDLMSYDKDSFVFEIDRESVNLLAQDEATTLEEIDLEIATIDAGEGRYANYSFDQRQNLINIAGGKQTELESTALMKAEANQSKALTLIATSGTSVDDNGVDLAANTVAEFKKLGREDLAITLERSVVAGQNVFNTMESLTFGTSQDITKAQEAARQKVFSATRENILEATTEQQLLNEAIKNRNEQLAADPAGFVRAEYSRKNNNKNPTKAEIIGIQQNMGLTDDQISPLTATELGTFITNVTDADNAEDVMSAFNSIMFDETGARHPKAVQNSIMSQLAQSGVSPVYQFVNANPNSARNTGLIQSLNKEALRQDITAKERDAVAMEVLANDTVMLHEQSMLGSTFADFEGDMSFVSGSDTNEMVTSRNSHFDMIVDYAIYLADKNGVEIDATDPKKIRQYVEQASKVFSDKYSYLENIRNNSVSLRLEKGVAAGNENAIKVGMVVSLNDVSSSFDAIGENIIVYKPPELGAVENSPEHKAQSMQYATEVSNGGGWVSAANGDIILVDKNGGVVFEVVSGMGVEQDTIQPVVRDISFLVNYTEGRGGLQYLIDTQNFSVMSEQQLREIMGDPTLPAKVIREASAENKRRFQ
tara:strand:- start:286 stop:2640 length:2355 start_codon:yes stop_codon:yes gene_type:complete